MENAPGAPGKTRTKSALHGIHIRKVYICLRTSSAFIVVAFFLGRIPKEGFFLNACAYDSRLFILRRNLVPRACVPLD